jgi:hypothetical protein
MRNEPHFGCSVRQASRYDTFLKALKSNPFSPRRSRNKLRTIRLLARSDCVNVSEIDTGIKRWVLRGGEVWIGVSFSGFVTMRV